MMFLTFKLKNMEENIKISELCSESYAKLDLAKSAMQIILGRAAALGVENLPLDKIAQDSAHIANKIYEQIIK